MVGTAPSLFVSFAGRAPVDPGRSLASWSPHHPALAMTVTRLASSSTSAAVAGLFRGGPHVDAAIIAMNISLRTMRITGWAARRCPVEHGLDGAACGSMTSPSFVPSVRWSRPRGPSLWPPRGDRQAAILDRVAASHQQVRELIRDAESVQRERFATELADELALVDDASSLLAKVVRMAVARGGEARWTSTTTPAFRRAPTPPRELIALRYLGIRGVRIVRAAQSVLATGYQPEARVYERILLEIIEHTQSILKDPSGKTALDWLKGNRRRGVTARVRAMCGRAISTHGFRESRTATLTP